MLVNQTRKEVVTFAHLPATTVSELTGNPPTAAMTTWYLLHHRNDQVAFVSDSCGEWPFPTGSPTDLVGYTDVTDQVVEELIKARILRDDGIAWADEDEPETVYIRALGNVWLD